MLSIKRLLYLAAVTLLVAGIVHIIIVLLIPSYAAKDAWAKLGNADNFWKFAPVTSSTREVIALPLLDPAFSVSACRFDLKEAPLKVQANGNLAFWSVAIFDRLGRNIYSFNDRTAIEGQLSLLVVNAVQMARLRKDQPDELKESVLVEADQGEGFVLIRALRPDNSWAPIVDTYLQDAVCDRYELDAENGNS